MTPPPPGEPYEKTVGRLLADARRRLAAADFGPAPREAALLLARILGLGEAGLLARPERAVPAAAAARFEALLARRLHGEPVAYLLGEREFFGRLFRVDRRVLVPRPESEHLVEAALELELPPAARVLDVGTGSGCLAVTLALERPAHRVFGIDLSPGALAVARDNARRLGAPVRLAATDLVAGLALATFDLVTANLPYVDPAATAALSVEIVRYEPPEALFGGESGLALIARLLDGLAALRPGAYALLEVGAGQRRQLEPLLARSPFRCLEIRPDYAGIPRVVVLERSPG